ncbi:hypothetical protein NEF87_003477 [Candidatus Lokiarchaeum ossiferum]|uniref:IFT52 GIFT domain-containing protein n=1 Tax=Candidatus Lokiarchaeum ossiferum TaxID=2951803 RepID=A0ABY6HUI4_9ARCH|nr:hypothetical protein NEF87_003477 [Candidatus Lokiarchaeum sp. B-35]
MSQSFVIGFDQAHKERGKITNSLSKLAELLDSNGYKCENYAEFPITTENLSPYDIVVFACPDNSRLSRQEIESIKKWVKKGGSLLLLSHAGGDKGRRSNLSELAEEFGMIFENNQVLDKASNLGVENLPTITDFGFPHPITEGISDICFRAGCSLTISSATVTPVFSSGPNAEPFESPLMLACELGEGRIVSIGSYEMFRDKIMGGINYGSHSQLAMNVFSWLRTSKRTQIDSQSQLNVTAEDGIPDASRNDQGRPAIHTTIPEITYSSTVKIKTDEELFKAFEDMLTEMISFKERMLSEFDNLQTNMANLMRVVIAKEEDLIHTQTYSEPPAAQPPQTSPTQVSSGNNPLDNIMASISSLGDNETKNATPANFNPPPTLAPPPNLEPSYVADQNQSISAPSDYSSRIEPTSTDPIEVKPKKTVPPATQKTKEELKAEHESLENKLNSIRNLSAFVEKKFASGNLTQKNYEKQLKKLESDSKKTRYRIDEIEKLLKK